MHISRIAKVGAVLFLVAITGETADAQMGFGIDLMGGNPFFMYGLDMNTRLFDPTWDLHERSMTHAASVAQTAADEWAKGNAVRGDSFRDNLRGESRYSIALREESLARASQPARRPAAPRPAPVVAAAPRPAAPPVPAFAYFFNNQGVVDWPLDGPSSGELGRLRNEADRALIASLQEARTSGRVSLQGITQTRAKLTAYGQLALDQVRNERSPQIANGFHAFLMAVYSSLEGTEGM